MVENSWSSWTKRKRWLSPEPTLTTKFFKWMMSVWPKTVSSSRLCFSPRPFRSILVRTEVNAVIGEVNLLLRGKLKQFRGLCQANVVSDTVRMDCCFFFNVVFYRSSRNQRPMQVNQHHSIVIWKASGISLIRWSTKWRQSSPSSMFAKLNNGLQWKMNTILMMVNSTWNWLCK